MVTYKLELSSSTYHGQWIILASCGNHVQWPVGHYRDKRHALERLERLHIMAEAQEAVLG
jgi:hypothetical protein